jgi:hypothetical protein
MNRGGIVSEYFIERWLSEARSGLLFKSGHSTSLRRLFALAWGF